MQPIQITFPAAVATAVCALQTGTANVPLIINGTLLDLPATMNGTRRARFGAGIERTVSLTVAGANLSGVNFTIVGTDLKGAAVSEVLAGPSSNTVSTTAMYAVVTSITPDGTVGTAMSAGSGSTGRSNWVLHDSYQTPFTVSFVGDVTATCDYSVFYTPDDPNVVASPYSVAWAAALTGATTDQAGSITVPAVASRFVINSSSGSGALTGTFQQAGH